MSKRRFFSRTLLALASTVASASCSDTPTGPASAPPALPVSVPHALTTAVKTIGVSPTRLAFIWYATRHTLPPSQVLKISNLGSGTLTWTAASTSWLKLSSKSGTAPSTVTVWFSPSPWNPPIGYNGYRPGSLSGSIKVSATGATNTPLTVPVVLYIRYY